MVWKLSWKIQLLLPGWNMVSIPNLQGTTQPNLRGTKAGVEWRHHIQALLKPLQRRELSGTFQLISPTAAENQGDKKRCPAVESAPMVKSLSLYWHMSPSQGPSFLGVLADQQNTKGLS